MDKVKNSSVNLKGKTFVLDKDTSSHMTGYASIDKPWLKHYSEETINSEIPKMTMYDYMSFCNRNHTYSYAINYMDNKITYGDMFNSINEVAKSFIAMGVEQGDVVTLCIPTTPETIYLIYALNKIGAVVNLVDPRTNESLIAQFIREANSNIVIMLDIMYPKMKKVINKVDVDYVVAYSAGESMPLAKKIIYSLSNHIKKCSYSSLIKNDTKFMTWEKFIDFGCGTSVVRGLYEPNRPAAIIHTGGTTGIPKGVVLSNENLNAMAFQYANSGIHHELGQIFLDIMPPFIAYGLVNGIHMPLCLGMNNVLVTMFDPKKFDSLLIKYKPAHFMGVPTHYESLLSSKKMRSLDMSFLVSPGSGGDSANTDLEERINEFLSDHHCPSKLAKGYGLTEMSSAVCVCVSNDCNLLGSVGIPLCKSNVAVFDQNSENELQYNNIGEICVNGSTIMLGYLNNQEETDRVIKKHQNGVEWLHTGDLGYMTEDGIVYVLGRIKRMIIRPDGHNVFPSMIENVVSSHYAVDNCSVVGVNSEFHNQGSFPKVVIVLKENYRGSNKEQLRQLVSELDNLCEEHFPERDVPYYYEFISNLPMTPIGKCDYKKLENISLDVFCSRKYYKDFGETKPKMKVKK